jgi:hypothetical protein
MSEQPHSFTPEEIQEALSGWAVIANIANTFTIAPLSQEDTRKTYELIKRELDEAFVRCARSDPGWFAKFKADVPDGEEAREVHRAMCEYVEQRLKESM